MTERTPFTHDIEELVGTSESLLRVAPLRAVVRCGLLSKVVQDTLDTEGDDESIWRTDTPVYRHFCGN